MLPTSSIRLMSGLRNSDTDTLEPLRDTLEFQTVALAWKDVNRTRIGRILPVCLEPSRWQLSSIEISAPANLICSVNTDNTFSLGSSLLSSASPWNRRIFLREWVSWWSWADLRTSSWSFRVDKVAVTTPWKPCSPPKVPSGLGWGPSRCIWRRLSWRLGLLKVVHASFKHCRNVIQLLQTSEGIHCEVIVCGTKFKIHLSNNL